jgi:hypothetical protein
MFDDDDVGFLFLLPWPIGLIVLLFMIGAAVWYWSLPTEKKAEMCAQQAAKYHVENRFDEQLGCLVRLDATHWQKIKKYQKSGIIEAK